MALRRFTEHTPAFDHVYRLKPDSAAAVEGRTLFRARGPSDIRYNAAQERRALAQDRRQGAEGPLARDADLHLDARRARDLPAILPALADLLRQQNELVGALAARSDA